MELPDLLLICVVPILSLAGLVIAAYLLAALGRGVSSLMPADGVVWGRNPTPNDSISPPDPEHHIQVVAQLLFTHLRHDGIFVDTVILEALGQAEGLIRAGAPLSLRVERPGPEVLGASSEAILELWSGRGEVVAIDISVRGDDVRAELSNGRSRVVLDITEAAGLP